MNERAVLFFFSVIMSTLWVLIIFLCGYGKFSILVLYKGDGPLIYVIYLSIYVSIYLSVCLSVCLSVSIYLSISCCSHLEHTASVKRFVSPQFLNLRQSVGPLGGGISPTQGRYLQKITQTQNKRTHIHALSGIRIHDPSVEAGEDSSRLRPRGHCDRRLLAMYVLFVGDGLHVLFDNMQAWKGMREKAGEVNITKEGGNRLF
jgi:hypothetical protein